MKVRELIEKLQQFDPEMMVVLDGYEGGVDELKYVQSANVALNFNEEGYYGKHEPVTDGYLTAEEQKIHPIVTVVYLPR